ncbi:TPA: hypothetical protein G9F22_000838 [Salmonella enterica]|uniref:Uncharacterized protein n=1 Tax=Salmonella enterica TaxID=28901 RepID=A0A744RS82_SALER|nr:hypothetical protein [Salmonella enterica]HAF4931808.1 hypothetical protein [Salmonella enterica]HAF5248396.1 hypothetical protein [Salmonella enterica]HAF5746243.1 hypothetical protein [Salmonella enterica]
MESACRLSTNVIRLSKSISKHSLRSFLHCAECVFLAPSDSAKFIAFLCKKNRRATPFHLSGRDTARCGHQPDASESEGDLAPFVPESVSSCVPSHLSARCPKRKVSHVINKGNYG